MPGHDIIVIGASAGGIEALLQLIAPLPKDLPAALFVVVHLSGRSTSILPDIFNRKGKIRAAHAEDGEAIAHGRIYVAPPDYHLLVKRGYIRLVQGPIENNFRPAIDPLFRTAAKAYKRQVVGVVLSGMLDDGTAGLIDVKRLGGVAVVQHPDDALFSSMPKSAIKYVAADHILPASAIAPVLVRLAHEVVLQQGDLSVNSEGEIDMEPDIAELDGVALRQQGHPGTTTNFTCPDCHGTLFQLHERNFLQFRCRVGHAFSAQSLIDGQANSVEAALWVAIRSLEERAELMQKMAANARTSNRMRSAERYEALAQEAIERSDSIRQALFQNQLPAMPGLNDPVSNENGEESTDTLKVVVLVAEGGGLQALSQILSALPLDLKAAIIVVQHLDTQSGSSWMTDALNQITFPVKYPEEGDPLQAGIVYIAPPAKHLFITPNGSFCLSEAAFVGLACPSADLLLQSLAASFKERAIAVVLSGTGSDGVLGVQAIQKMSGKAIATDENTSEFFELPSAAIATGSVDFILPVDAIATKIVNLVVD